MAENEPKLDSMEDVQLSKEVQVCFKTTMPDKYQVPETEISLSTGSTAKQLTELVRQLIEEETSDQDVLKEVKSRKLNFMVNDTFLNLTLQDLLDHLNLSTEQTVEVYYFFALDKPKPQKSTPCEDWISKIVPLTGSSDLGSRQAYAVGFFEGDCKLYDGDSHAELMTLEQLHQGSQITDLLYF